MSIWKYAAALPQLAEEHRITIGEGQTPLVRSNRLGPALGLSRLYFKLESCNPSGSYKDRFAVMAVSDMLACGDELCLATSSGNTGSALSAACAVAGIKCYIAVVDGAPLNKIRNMQAYGAEIYTIANFGQDPAVTSGVMNTLHRLCEERSARLQISNYLHSPVGMVGCETIAYELFEQFSDIGPVDHVFTQAGAGAMTLAIAKGYERLLDESTIETGPAIHCVQPEGNNTIAGPLRDGLDRAQEVTCTTSISGVQVPNVIGGDEVIPACRRSKGNGHLVTDESVYEAQRRLAKEEGLLIEPAGAVSVAGMIQAVRQGEVGSDDVMVCTLTGIGFKDEAALIALTESAVCPRLAEFEQIESFLN